MREVLVKRKGRLQNDLHSCNPQEMSGEARKGKVTQLANYMKDRLANPWDHKVAAAPSTP